MIQKKIYEESQESINIYRNSKLQKFLNYEESEILEKVNDIVENIEYTTYTDISDIDKIIKRLIYKRPEIFEYMESILDKIEKIAESSNETKFIKFILETHPYEGFDPKNNNINKTVGEFQTKDGRLKVINTLIEKYNVKSQIGSVQKQIISIINGKILGFINSIFDKDINKL